MPINFICEKPSVSGVYDCRMWNIVEPERKFDITLFIETDRHEFICKALSEAVEQGGGEILDRIPFGCPVETHDSVIDVLRPAKYQGETYFCFTDFLRVLPLSSEVQCRHDAALGTFTILRPTLPPKGEARHVGTIETASGKKEVKRYENGSLLVKDVVSGAETELSDPSDIASYFILNKITA